MASEISWYFEETPEFETTNSTNKWLKNSCLGLLSGFVINYICCSDDYLLNINKSYLNHDYYTDIITFDNTDEGSNIIESDIFISIDRVKENAAKEKTTFDKEFCRVLIHGVLHLAGYKDKTRKEQDEMRAMEDKFLDLHPDF